MYLYNLWNSGRYTEKHSWYEYNVYETVWKMEMKIYIDFIDLFLNTNLYRI